MCVFEAGARAGQQYRDKETVAHVIGQASSGVPVVTVGGRAFEFVSFGSIAKDVDGP